MDRTYIAELRSKIGQTVKVQGWLQTLRDQKSMQFLIVRDPTGLVQVTHAKGNDAELSATISALAAESAITITGRVEENPIVKLGGLEIQLESLQLESPAESPLPFDPFGATLPSQDFRMDWRFLDLRRPEGHLFFDVETVVEAAMREYWLREHFLEIHTPKLMGAPSESGAELFALDYFDTRAYLAQSPQFYKQMAMAAGLERVFEIGPVFRADPSFTSRHMTEFTSVDMEMSWIESHEDVMSFEEHWLQYIYGRVKEELGKRIEETLGFELQVPEVPFPRLTMQEVHAILGAQGYKLPPGKQEDIDPGGERVIADYVKSTFGHDFVFLTDWNFSARPFYHMCYPDNPQLTRSFDLIANGLEITTGAQREHRYDVLTRQAQAKGLHLEPLRFYLDFFRYGCPPHGGFGLGLARTMMAMLHISSVREAVFLFRGPNRLEP
jgi:aspartyl-tRNA synthetase